MGNLTDHARGLTRRHLLVRSGALGATAIVGVAPQTAAGQETTGQEGTDQPSGGTLRMALAERPAGLDPLAAEERPPDALAQLVFGGLYTYDASTGLVPFLAAGEPQIADERREYVVEVREDAQFQNGDPVTAADVRYSVRQARERDSSGRLATVLESVEATADRTVQFLLSEAYAPFMHLLTAPVVPEAVREDDPEEFRRRPIGAGPFRVAERLPDESLRLNRWTDYWDEPSPRLQAVEFAAVETPTTRINALASGETDVAEAIPPQLYPDIAEKPDAQVVDASRMDYVHLAFNCRAGPTADPAVREGIDHCVSMPQFVSEFVDLAGQQTASPIPPPLAADWEFPVDQWREISRDRNIETAREHLESADVPDDWTPTILVPDEEGAESYEQLALAVANGLREAGYSASVELLAPETFQQRRVTGDPDEYDMYVDRWTAIPDPDAFTYPLFATAAEGETNGTYYRVESVQQKLETARRAIRKPERRDLYADAITTILEDRAHLPAFVTRYSFGVSVRVQDFDAHPVTAFRLVSGYNNVSVDG